MNIEFYNNSSQSNVLEKKIELIGSTVVLEPYDTIDLLNPVVLVNYNAAFLTSNYAYIPELKRYYFIQNVGLETAKRMRVVLRVDPLMSFKDSILGATVTVLRNENIGSTNVVDNKLPVDPKDLWFEGIDFPQQPLIQYGTEPENYLQYVLVIRN